MPTIEAAAFGDVLIDDGGGEPHVLRAPQYTRVSLAALGQRDYIDIDHDGRRLIIAGQVAYRPVAFNADQMVLICERLDAADNL